MRRIELCKEQAALVVEALAQLLRAYEDKPEEEMIWHIIGSIRDAEDEAEEEDKQPQAPKAVPTEVKTSVVVAPVTSRAK